MSSRPPLATFGPEFAGPAVHPARREYIFYHPEKRGQTRTDGRTDGRANSGVDKLAN